MTSASSSSGLPRPGVRAVIWDFGGVLTTSPFAAFNRFEEEQGLPRDFLRRTNAANPDGNAWALLERNLIDLDEFDRRFAAETAARGHEVRGRKMMALLRGDLRPAMVTALRRCREHVRVACITNNIAAPGGAAHAQDWAQVWALFDHVLESSRVGLRKPDPRIYHMACQALEVAPHEAVYLDDLGINLKPARALGMTTIKVGDPGQALRELEAATGFCLLAEGPSGRA